MQTFVIDSGDFPTIQTLAQAMIGLMLPAPGIYSGKLPGDLNDIAAFVLNVLGPPQEPTGQAMPDPKTGEIIALTASIPGVYLSTLGINGLNPFTNGKLAIPAGVKIYSLVTSSNTAPFWSLDGTTTAPTYIATAGVMV